MCLGIPGQVVELLAEHPHLASVDIFGEKRKINIGLLVEDGVDVQAGDWVLIELAMAMMKITAAEARLATKSLEMMRGPSLDDDDATAAFDEPEEVARWV